jgi:translocator protein
MQPSLPSKPLNARFSSLHPSLQPIPAKASGPPAVHQLFMFVRFLSLTLLSGFVGMQLTKMSVDTWYPTLSKPDFNPPDAWFAPVWTTLYVLMAIAMWSVWRQSFSIRQVRRPFSLWLFQLILNIVWSGMFFGLHQVGGALLSMMVLWAFMLPTLRTFFEHSKLAGMLMLPYAGWITFALVLNASIYYLNR